MKFIILDRDGVINNDSDAYIKSPDEWHPIPGSLEAIAHLHHHGYRILIATNQSGIGRNLFDMQTLNAIHDKMLREIARVGGRIDGIFYCPHTPEMACGCRKPKAGMFLEIAERYHISLSNVPVIGDSLRDLQAASTVGAQPVLVLTGKGEKTAQDPLLPPNTLVFKDLATAAVHLTA